MAAAARNPAPPPPASGTATDAPGVRLADLTSLNLGNAFAIGLKEIWAHKFRSLLTMLGIILGVASLVAMSALVQGLENGAKAALIEIGGIEKIRIEDQDIPPSQAHLADQSTGLTIRDVEALAESAPSIAMIQPEMRLQRGMLAYGGRSMSSWMLLGTTPNAVEMNQHEVEHGRMFTDLDDEEARSVCVIGTAVRDELFGSPEAVGREIIPLGERIELNGVPLTVIGMFKHYESEQDRKLREVEAAKPRDETGPARSRGWGSRGSGMGGFVYRMKNSTVYMPLSTMALKFRSAYGSNSTPDLRLSVINVRIPGVDNIESGLQQARNILLQTHKGIEDFSFRTQEEWSEQIDSFIRSTRFSQGIIAAISLIVGGIGIMNIMLASIAERVREIGIRKAVGASNLNIFIQILVESIVIALLGGLAGLVASYGLVEVLTLVSPTGNTPVITLGSMMVAFSFSALVGVAAGFIPAVKAGRLSPIQALRYG